AGHPLRWELDHERSRIGQHQRLPPCSARTSLSGSPIAAARDRSSPTSPTDEPPAAFAIALARRRNSASTFGSFNSASAPAELIFTRILTRPPASTRYGRQA